MPRSACVIIAYASPAGLGRPSGHAMGDCFIVRFLGPERPFSHHGCCRCSWSDVADEPAAMCRIGPWYPANEAATRCGNGLRDRQILKIFSCAWPLMVVRHRLTSRPAPLAPRMKTTVIVNCCPHISSTDTPVAEAVRDDSVV